MHLWAFVFMVNDDRMSAAGLAGFLAAYFIFIALAIIFGLIINWRIASKAGYAGALSLLMLIPLVNLVIVILFAFSEWPVERELRTLRGGARMAVPTR